jgi:hypothetical protein
VFSGGSLWGADTGSGIGGFVSEVGVYEKQASSVKEYAYTEEKNFRFRPSMEDSMIKITKNL